MVKNTISSDPLDLVKVREVIAAAGGPAKFRRKLQRFGVDIPMTTVKAWNCNVNAPAARIPIKWGWQALQALVSRR